MRILVATHNYPRFPGDPAGAFVARIAAGAAAAGHAVRVVAPHAPGLTPSEFVSGVTVHRFRYAPESMERVAYTGDLHRGTLAQPLAAAAFPAFMLGFKRAIRRAVQEHQPDLIHAHWWLPAGFLARGMGARLVVTCHGSDVRLLERWSAFRTLARPVFHRASAVTTVSAFLAEDIRRHLGTIPAPVHVLPMPVDAAHFAQGRSATQATPPRILYAGNLVPSKGVDVLLEAVHQLQSRGIACGLRILGEGPERAALEAQGRALGIRGLEWSDFVPQDQMPSEYGQSMVTVLPTRGNAEGLGLTLVEALLAGSAVVGTRAGGIPEVIDHETTGLLVEESPASLADAIARLLQDESFRDRLVAAGQAHAESVYAEPRAVARFLDLYRDVADRR